MAARAALASATPGKSTSLASQRMLVTSVVYVAPVLRQSARMRKWTRDTSGQSSVRSSSDRFGARSPVLLGQYAPVVREGALFALGLLGVLLAAVDELGQLLVHLEIAVGAELDRLAQLLHREALDHELVNGVFVLRRQRP